MSKMVSYRRENNIGVITVDNPPVNALSQGVRQGLLDCVAQLAADDEVSAGVLICAGRTFIAGADIKEFGQAPREPAFAPVLAAMENLQKPLVAAIHGTALGGGLETALCCHYRCAVASAKVGLPEVKLGLLPGAGGTQRLPRLVGVEQALDMIVSGDPIGAEFAHELGIVDRIITGDLREGALAYAESLVREGQPLRKVRDRDDKLQQARDNPHLFDTYRQGIARKVRGFEAPDAIIEAVQAAVNLPFDEGLAKEKMLIDTLMPSRQSIAQRYLFFSEREVAKIPDVPRDTPTMPIGKAAVVGAGTMGGGIAMCFANAGIPVYLTDTAEEPLQKGFETIRRNYASTVSKGRLAQEEMERRMALIHPTTEQSCLAEVDIVIEAVFEEMALKKEVFADLERICRPETILATNTSTLDVDEIASVTSRPDKVIGTHFFSPANIMGLLEIVRGRASGNETIASAMALARALGKVGVLVGLCDGFVGNRMLHRRNSEANFLLEEGALPAQVDRVVFDFGFPMGPFAMGDMAGLDIGWRVRKAQAASRPKGQRYSALGDKICEIGRFGQKTSAGWYRYEPGSRVPLDDPEVEALIVRESEQLGITRRDISDEEIIARTIYPMINEGAKILEEGIAIRAGDIDVIWVHGYGWPRYRGGPMFYADTVGLDKVLHALKRMEVEHGPQFAPAALLEQVAADGGAISTYRAPGS